jgi:hypothetical protein
MSEPGSPTDARPPSHPGGPSRPVAPPVASRGTPPHLPPPPVGPPRPPPGGGHGGASHGGGPHGGSPGGGRSGSGRRAGWPVAVVAVVAVVGLLGAVLMVRSSGSGTGVGPEPQEQDAPGTTAGPPADEEEMRAVVDEVSAFVEEERGLEFREPVDVELLEDEEFEARLLEDFDEDAEELEATATVLRALGLIDPDADVVESLRALLGAGVVGFYDSETGELVVRGASITPSVRMVMAHELTHALDDQHFELERPELEDAEDESDFAFTALVEGSARRVESAYLESLSEEEAEQALLEQLQMQSEDDLSAIPSILVEQLTAPYELGLTFVRDLIDAGGQEQLDAAFRAPPTTSEQVVEPQAYLDGEGAVPVEAPAVTGDVVEEGTLGQLLITQVLEAELDSDEVAEAAAGWGGDRAVAWRDGERACMTAAVVGDTAEDTTRLSDAFTEWAGAHGDAQVTPRAGGQPFTVEACAG